MPSRFLEENDVDTANFFYLSLDIVVPLYIADQVETNRIEVSRNKNIEYIKKALEIAVIDENECDIPLADDEREEILEKLGEPPYSCYNIYIITIRNDNNEKIVYVGQTDSVESRFKNGHKVALKLHNPIYKDYEKLIYFGTITFLSKDDEYLPMECVSNNSQAKKLLNDVERILIYEFQPEFNVQEWEYKILQEPQMSIENHTGVSDFLDNYVIDFRS